MVYCVELLVRAFLACWKRARRRDHVLPPDELQPGAAGHGLISLLDLHDRFACMRIRVVLGNVYMTRMKATSWSSRTRTHFCVRHTLCQGLPTHWI